MELSGATVTNWVCKTANLIVDGFARPGRVGLLLPLHWQAICFLLGGAAAGCQVVIAAEPDDLAGCTLAFVSGEVAEAALDAGVDDVIASSGHPLGARLAAVPTLVLDAAVEIPVYGDHFGGPHPTSATVLLGGQPFVAPDLALTPADRVLTTLALTSPEGLGVVLSALRAGASLVLVPGLGDLDAIATAERVTRRFG